MITRKEDVAQQLRNHSISPSYPRKRILEYLVEEHNHPTVSMIYQSLVDEIPSLSKTTVYNTLKLFVQQKLVEEITIEGNEKRYDLFNPQAHAHFRCRGCGMLFDIELHVPPIKSDALEGFVVESQSVYFTGLCAQCVKTSTKIPDNGASST